VGSRNLSESTTLVDDDARVQPEAGSEKLGVSFIFEAGNISPLRVFCSRCCSFDAPTTPRSKDPK
jgi:hypothetical protein